MAEIQGTTELKAQKKPVATVIATALIAGALGITGTNLATDTKAPTEPINANVEMQAYTSAVTGLEAVGMVQKGFTPMIHIKFDNNTGVKAYNIYLDGEKVNKDPIVVLGAVARYTVLDLKVGKTYKVSVAAIGNDNKEASQTEQLSVKVK